MLLSHESAQSPLTAPAHIPTSRMGVEDDPRVAQVCRRARELLGTEPCAITDDSHSPAAPPSVDVLSAYRFLVAAKGHMEHAARRVVRTADFRRQQQLDRILLFPSLLPIRGYSEVEMCTALNLPYVEEPEWNPLGRSSSDTESPLFRVGHIRTHSYGSDSASSDATFIKVPKQSDFEAASQLSSNSTRGPGSDSEHNRKKKRGPTSVECTPIKEAAAGDCDSKRPRAYAERLRGLLGNRFFAREQADSHGACGSSEASRSDSSTGSAAAYRGRSTHGAESLLDDSDPDFVEAASRAEHIPVSLPPGVINFHALLKPIMAVILKHCPISIHYWDKEGRPVIFCKLSSLNPRLLLEELFKLTPVNSDPQALCTLFQAYTMEVAQQVVNYQNQRMNHGKTVASPRAVSSCLVILDCAKAKLSRVYRGSLSRIAKPVVEMSQQHYPNTMHRIYLINCSNDVRLLYHFFLGVLQRSTRRKISFCSKSNVKQTLLKLIDAQYLPVEYGGTCTCHGGCNPSVHQHQHTRSSVSLASSNRDAGTTEESISKYDLGSESMSQGIDSSPATNTTVEQVAVKPLRCRTIIFDVTKRMEITWEFVVRNKRKLNFSVVFIPVGGDGSVVTISEPNRCRDGAGHFIAPRAGAIIFRWSNQKSWFFTAQANVRICRST